MADRILVPFRGDGGGTGELSWGQRVLWDAMRRKRTWMPIGAVRPMPAGTTVDDIVDDLGFLMRHYPTLRTRLRLDRDGPEQVVWQAGEVALELVEAGGDDPATVAERVRRRFRDTDYDAVDEWPVRMAVVRHRGVPTHRVWVMSHLVADATGAAIMASELADRDASGSAAAMTPLQQAGWQHSPAGQRQSGLALRHLERLLRTVPARRHRAPDHHRARPRYWNGTFCSRALHLAVGAVAARTGAGTAAVLLAAFAIALSRVTGMDPVVTRVVVNNRFRPRLATAVSPIVQNGLCVLDVAGMTVDEAVAHARRQAMTAYKYAYYDPARLDELVGLVRSERGEDVDIGCFFNDRRQQHPAGPIPTPDQVRAALPDSTFRWDEKQDDKPYDPLFVTVDDTPDALSILVYIDTHHMSPTDAETCIRQTETVAVGAAF